MRRFLWEWEEMSGWEKEKERKKKISVYVGFLC